jgi:hypothetical protein
MANQLPVIEERADTKEGTARTEAPPPASPPVRGTRPTHRTRWHLRHGPRRGLAVLGVVLAVLALLAVFGSHLFDERLRRAVEVKINQSLTGYKVTLGHAHVNPLNLALTLRDLVIRQEANPNPPVADIPRLKTSIEWPALLAFHLVADAVFDRPRVHINLPQIKEEAHDQVRFKDRGWQRAFESIYPLKFDHVAIREGELAYIDVDAQKPFLVSHWNLDAKDIRNIHTRPGVYPSAVHTEGIVFDTGRAVVDGHADFLAEPYPGVHAVYSALGIPLDRLRPIISRTNLSLQGGVLASKGEFEFSPHHSEARVDDLTIRGLRLDYLHSTGTTAVEKTRAEKVKTAVKGETTVPVRVRNLRLLGGELGFVDRAKSPPFRVFLDHLDLAVTDLQSGSLTEPVRARLAGRFMGTGTARGTAEFRPGGNGPNFNLALAVEEASLPKVNDLLRAYGKFDVAAGTFSVYTEMAVKNRHIDGYVKPLFKDVQVYDPKQDKDKPPLKKLYEKVVGAAAHVLENHKRDEVATKTDLSGSLDNPKTSLWETIAHLLQNAFVKAIVPGFDREIAALRGKG